MDETKKPEQQEQEAAPSEERNQELSSKELDHVAGGELSLNFTKILMTYTQQNADGAADGNEGAK